MGLEALLREDGLIQQDARPLRPGRHAAVTERFAERGVDAALEPARPRLAPIGVAALAVAPVVALVAADVARRRTYLEHLPPFELHFYLRTVVVSAAFVTALVVAASSRDRGRDAVARRTVARLLLVVGALLTVGAQVYTFGRYHAYLNPRAILVGTSMLPSIGQQLWTDRLGVARALLPPLVVAIGWPLILRRVAAASAAMSRLALDVALVALGSALFVDPSAGGEQGGTPEFMYVSAMGQLARAHWGHNEYATKTFPEARHPEPLPALVARPARPRNVLLILDESVRQMSVCNAFAEDCRYTPRTNRAAPDRIALDQMRAVDSTTAISLAVVFNGLVPTAPRGDLHTAPLLWEYAHAAGLATDYWTSQNLLFGNSGTWLEGIPVDHRASATDLDPGAPLDTGADDGALVDRVLADLRQTASAQDDRPRLSVVHLSNTHFPYITDESYAPFKPDDEDSAEAIHNLYQNGIYLQDRAVGRLLESLRRTEAGRSTVVVFTSDHGEQLREKGSVGHTGTLFDPELRVPFWVDAPPGTLTAEEEAHLRARAQTPTTLLDLLPTLLDLAGVWSDPNLAPFRARLAGESLLRGGSPETRATVLTNCTELWSCAFKNWGAIRGDRKLVATASDHAWSCFDLARDPEENHDLGAAGCGDLVDVAEGAMHGRPF
jgi:glucan phosphoethanolaminetransferase (alkaline phosphatase superfamily)